MITIETYRSRIGSFRQKNYRGREFLSRLHRKYGRNQENVMSFRILSFLKAAVSGLMLLGLFFNGEHEPDYQLINHPPTVFAATAPISLIYAIIILQKSAPFLCNPLPPEDRNFLARYKYGNRRDNGIKIIHWNKGPSFLGNKKDDVEALIEKYHPHIFGLSEANLFSHHDMSEVQYPGYYLHTYPTLNNPELLVSRVVVYTHSSLVVKLRPDLMDNTISAIWLEVGLPRRKKILVCNVYREWGYLRQQDKSSHTIAAQLSRWQTFLKYWEKALIEDKEVIVTGDVNIDSLKWCRDDLASTDSTYKLKPLISSLFEVILPHGVSQHVNVATHSWAGKEGSCLDHLYTNRPDRISDVEAHINGGSDHRVIFVVRYAKSLKKTVRYIRKRCFKNFDEEGFKAEIKLQKFFDIYTTTDVNQAVKLLTEKLTSALDKFAPVRTIQVRSKYAPWVTLEVKKEMAARDRAQQVAAATQKVDDWRHYKHLRNSVNRSLRLSRKSWETNQLNSFSNNATDLWRNIKGWMGWKNSGPPTQLFTGGRIVSSPSGLATEMNTFFTNKVKQLLSRLPTPTTDPLENLSSSMESRTCIFSLESVHPEEVLKIVTSLKNSKSTGLDSIDTSTLKLIIGDILPAVTHIINLSIANLEFPSTWKVAKIIPLLKKGDPMNPSNYRPVALLPILSKVLERVVFKQVVKYVETNGLLHPSHHGSRAKHSTSTAIIEMYDTWIEGIERGEMTGVMMLDLSAAFDLVDHKLLLKKLELLGFDQQVVVWFWTYLTGRSQCVYVDGKFSDHELVPVGVPQGSVLGALLYILYVDDLPEVVHGHGGNGQVQGKGGVKFNMNCSDCGSLCCYVDDSTYMYSHSDPGILTQKLSEQYKKLAEYMSANRLVINDSKTHLLVMGTKRHDSLRSEVKINTGAVVIEPVGTQKLLGINIHQSLKWKEHIISNDRSMIKTLRTRLSALSKIAVNANFKTRLMVANACFMSIISYMVAVWGGTEEYVIRAVQVMQNKAARCVTRLSWYTPTRLLLQQCNWLSIKQMILYHTAVQVWRVLDAKCPVFIESKLQLTVTRSASQGNLRVPVVESSLARKSFLVRSATVWNRIPPDIRSSTSIQVFKRKLKKWIKLNIELD